MLDPQESTVSHFFEPEKIPNLPASRWRQTRLRIGQRHTVALNGRGGHVLQRMGVYPKNDLLAFLRK